MIINYLKFNNLGVLTQYDLKPISQGNHNVDYFYIAYDIYDYTNSYATIAVTLPDGTHLPELSTSMKDFDFGDNQYRGFMFKLSKELTSISGTLKMTINLRSVETDWQLCSSRLNLEIYKTDVTVEPTITDFQYQQLLQTIADNYEDLKSQIDELKNSKGG